MARKDYYLPPRNNDETKEKSRCAERAIDRIMNFTPEEKEAHRRDLEDKIAKVNQHSYETNRGQARTLAKYEFKRYIG